ncbi:MAG: hypothetical protein JWN72_2018 [Thermoleophilia bacterium]|nr:hypothetical protein [Thermoleophilia bacterium]
MTSSAVPPQRPARLGPLRPAWWWYLVAVAVLATGAFVSVRNAVHAVGHVRDGYHQLKPGTPKSVELPAARTVAVYAIWIDGSAGAQKFSSTMSTTVGAGTGAATTATTEHTPPPPKATVTVTDPDGDPVAFRPRSGGSTSTIEINDRHGLQVGEFTTEAAGRYRVLVAFDAPEGGGDTPSRAAITSFSLLGEFRDIVVPSLLGFLLGMTIIVVTAVRRGVAKRRRRQAQHEPPTMAVPMPGGGAAPAYRPPTAPPDLPGSSGPFL